MHCIVVLCLIAGVLASPEENIGVYDPNLFEGDMILTPEQRQAALSGGDVSEAGRRARGSMISDLWPGGVVYYTIEKELSDVPKAYKAIKDGIAMWESTTCLKFIPRTNEEAYIRFYARAGCKSAIGYKGKRQSISLSKSSNCWRPGVAAHEIAHALGFYHEQSRPDRDEYVTIYWDNIRLGMESQFQKYDRSTIDSLGTPYDYDSIMHYHRKAFGQNKITIQPKTPGVRIGQRSHLSETDILQMNLLYKCPGAGTRPPRPLPTQATTTRAPVRTSRKPPTARPTASPDSCVDSDEENCPRWAKRCGFFFVRQRCKKTCRLC